MYQILRTIYADALAVETEGHGFLQAVRANQATQALVVRGIVRLINESAEVGRDRSQQAARHAAAFAFGVLAKVTRSRQTDKEMEASSSSHQIADESTVSHTMGNTFPTALAARTFGKEILPTRRKVFISYSHKDARWLERLQVHLAPLEQEGILDLWDDTKIAAGSPWQASLLEAIETARVAIALVSADFLASSFIVKDELPRLLTRAASDGLVILPIIVSPCLFSSSGLSLFQAANDPRKPLSEMPISERERTLVKVANSIRIRLMERSRDTPSLGTGSGEERMPTSLS